MNHNRGTIYDLIASHGDVEDMIYFAVLMEGTFTREEIPKILKFKYNHKYNMLTIVSNNIKGSLFMIIKVTPY